MEDIFYELIVMDSFVRRSQERRGRRAAEKRSGFKRLGIIVERMERAAQLMQMVMAEIIMKDNGCAEENDQEKKGQGQKRPRACGLASAHDNSLIFNELVKRLLYCHPRSLSI